MTVFYHYERDLQRIPSAAFVYKGEKTNISSEDETSKLAVLMYNQKTGMVDEVRSMGYYVVHAFVKDPTIRPYSIFQLEIPRKQKSMRRTYLKYAPCSLPLIEIY